MALVTIYRASGHDADGRPRTPPMRWTARLRQKTSGRPTPASFRTRLPARAADPAEPLRAVGLNQVVASLTTHDGGGRQE
jgi:hypothetical protein